MNEYENKYKFLNSEELKLLYLISKSKIDYEYIKDLGSKKLVSFTKTYIKKIKKKNKKSEIKEYIKVEDIDVNKLFLYKKNKLSIKKIKKIYDSINDLNIEYYPDNKKILGIIKLKSYTSRLSYAVFMFVFYVLFMYEAIDLSNWNKENKDTKKIVANVNNNVNQKEKKIESEDLIEEDDYFKYLNVSILDVDFSSLLNQNKDTKGWIKVEGTNINYPFVQAGDNEYYLKHSFDNSYNKKGWVFLDYRNSIDNLSKNTILYAHGLVNNGMFGSLRWTMKKNWYTNKNNYIIKTSTLNNNYLWQVFSNYTIEPESYYITTDFYSDDEFVNFTEELKKRSIYDYNVDLNKDDKILTLSSCYDNKKRMVMHAKLIAVNKK